MLRSSIPTKFPKAFGANAGGAYIRPVPSASQIGIQAGAASLTDGFPPLTMTDEADGGVPPFGQDMNGILNQITLWNQWQQMGGAVPWDSTFSAQIGGYPAGAIVESATTLNVFWISIVDNNSTNPDTGGAGWILAGAAKVGVVTMKYINGAWNVFLPDGSNLSTVGSTSQGLQEAINYAVLNGYRLEVYGQGAKVVSKQNGTLNGTNIISGLSSTATLSMNLYVSGAGIPPNTQVASIDSPTQIHITNAATASGVKALTFANNPVFVVATAPITFPPIEQWSCSMYNLNVTFAAGAANGFIFDSALIVDFEFVGGQIVYEGNGYAVTFSPATPVVLDGIAAIAGCSFIISNVATPTAFGTATGVVGFNCSNGGVNGNYFSFIELNGAGAPGSSSSAMMGIQVFGQTALTGFEQNEIHAVDIHQVVSAGVQVGVGTSAQTSLRENIWQIGAIHPAGSASVGFDTFGSNDSITIGGITNEEGTLFNGVVLQSGAVGNSIFASVLGAGNANLIEAVPGSNYCYGNLRAPLYGANKGYYWTPDGTLTQYINNAGGGSGGTTTTWAIPFPTELLACTATAENLTVGYQAAGNQSGVTITTASSSGTFSVIGIGR